MEDNIDLKIKFTQTDLTDKDFLYQKLEQYGNVFNQSLIYENSDYLSKLHFINHFVGGSIVKHDRASEGDGVGDSEKSDKISAGMTGKIEIDIFEHIIDPEDYFARYYSNNENSENNESGNEADDDSDSFDEFDEFDEYDEYDEYSDEFGEGEMEDDENYGNELEIEFNTTGKLSVSKDQITITYDEADLVGMDNAMVNIMMDSKNPDIITIQKDNFIKSTLTLEKNRKSINDYDTEFANVTVSVTTLEMMNNMTKKGGEINLLYTIETNGSPTEMVAYSLSAQKLPKK